MEKTSEKICDQMNGTLTSDLCYVETEDYIYLPLTSPTAKARGVSGEIL